MSESHVGTPLQRFEDAALLKGQGRFVDDIKRRGMLHAAFVRSPHAHARIKSIDTERAKALPGVHAVLVAGDLPPSMRQERIPMLVPNPSLAASRTAYCLAVNEVCLVGEAVAMVIGDSRYICEDAVDCVEVEYEPLPAIANGRAAVAENAPPVHLDLPSNIASQFSLKYGDLDAAFGNAAHVFKETLTPHRGCGLAMEPRCVMAEFDAETSQMTVWSATQTPHFARSILAQILKLGADCIRVIAPDVGGGFGPKAIFYPEEAMVAHAARLLGCPVKFAEDRRENFMCTTQERDQFWEVEIAVDKDAKILGVRGTMLHDVGAYLPWGVIMPHISAATMPGPYVVPAYELAVTVAFTNMISVTPVRGAGRPQAVFAMERLMDRVARELRLDPAEVRRRNFVQPEQMPYPVGLIFRDGRPVIYDSGDYPRCLEAVLDLADYATFAQRQAEARRQGRYIGIGLGCYVEGTGLGPFEGVTVRILQDGRVEAVTGATNQGQGTRTTIAQIVADHLGCRPEDVAVTVGDTGRITSGVGAFASRQTVNAGTSAMQAATVVRQRLTKLAAHELGVSEDDIQVADGRATVKSGNRPSLGFAELARATQGLPGFSIAPEFAASLEYTTYFAPSQAAYCNGVHTCEVEVDIKTGQVKILNYCVSHDSGNLINPLIVDGQVQGGVAHGIGNALLEHMTYDENAQPVTTTLADYLVPMATDVPRCKIVHIETPSPLNPLGVKGAGEGGTIPTAAAVVAAIENALAPFAVHFTQSPLRPQAIVEALQAAGAYTNK